MKSSPISGGRLRGIRYRLDKADPGQFRIHCHHRQRAAHLSFLNASLQRFTLHSKINQERDYGIGSLSGKASVESSLKNWLRTASSRATKRGNLPSTQGKIDISRDQFLNSKRVGKQNNVYNWHQIS